MMNPGSILKGNPVKSLKKSWKKTLKETQETWDKPEKIG